MVVLISSNTSSSRIKMKRLLLLLILLTPMLSQGQSLFGFTPSEVREKRPGVDWTYGKWGEDDDMLTMSFSADGLYITYMFNSSNRSVFTIVTPLNKGSLQAMIEVYSKKYVIVDDYHWKYYDSGSLYRCALNQTNDGSYYFLWTSE